MKKQNKFFDFVAALAFEFDVAWDEPYADDDYAYEIVDERAPKRRGGQSIDIDIAG